MTYKKEYTVMRWLPAILMLAVLGACKKDTPPVQPEEQVSIIREDIEQPIEAPALEPLQTSISFAGGGIEMTEEAAAEIATIVNAPQTEENGQIILRGHSDAGGSDAVNMRISLERAELVRDALIQRGIAEDRITVIAFGEQNPIQPNALPDGEPNEPGREANRRVDVSVNLAEAVSDAEPIADTDGETPDVIEDTAE
ncbi:Peptidoglycan-binding protein ArfA [Alteripontixanthobacter maritimus]|uniref:Peptidoglycan-binding protein ArfA n=1 Tax=Alteripontixanthobacter maritimus TaxID=2161824 RepID=A0A369Q9N3_9SPHN|nr:OmpA family protein [Alteripontixanthobacter maritimus]RDC61060.1 Peptidoglycan-binding protein ArfA [Alteripontixanthobacter maritimus]